MSALHAQLYGICVHQGSSMQHGHYVACDDRSTDLKRNRSLSLLYEPPALFSKNQTLSWGWGTVWPTLVNTSTTITVGSSNYTHYSYQVFPLAHVYPLNIFQKGT